MAEGLAATVGGDWDRHLLAQEVALPGLAASTTPASRSGACLTAVRKRGCPFEYLHPEDRGLHRLAASFEDAENLSASLDDNALYVVADVFDRTINGQFNHTLPTTTPFPPMSVRIIGNTREDGLVPGMRERLGATAVDRTEPNRIPMRFNQRPRIDFKNIVPLLSIGFGVGHPVEALFRKPKEDFGVQQFILIRRGKMVGQSPSKTRIAHWDLVAYNSPTQTVSCHLNALRSMSAFDLGPFWRLNSVVVQECAGAQQAITLDRFP